MDPKHFESLYPADTRDQEISKVLEYIKAGKSAQIVGLPGVGRSNLLQLLSYNRDVRYKHLGENQKWFHFVYIDFSEVKKRSLFDVIKFMLISVVYSLSERGYENDHTIVNDILKNAVSFNDELILFQALKKSIDYLAIEKELTVVFLIDRFEQYVPDITEQFFLNLKILRSRAKYRFSTVFSLARPLDELLEQAVLSEFYEYVGSNIVYLRPYDPVGSQFRFSYLEKVTEKHLDKKISDQLLSITGGHNKLLLLSYETLLLKNNEKQDLADYIYNQKVIISALSDIWNFLTPSEKTYIETLVRKNSHQENDQTIPFLEHIGLLENNRITIPLFESYIAQQITASKVEKITYDSAMNEIKKGSENLTERLSPSEFRLLRYLITNEGKVCEKDELISSVWKDTQTQEGVTDQALDQIIYRLRKKIEDDPNNPTHIQTIKGRGVKFTS